MDRRPLGTSARARERAARTCATGGVCGRAPTGARTHRARPERAQIDAVSRRPLLVPCERDGGARTDFRCAVAKQERREARSLRPEFAAAEAWIFRLGVSPLGDAMPPGRRAAGGRTARVAARGARVPRGRRLRRRLSWRTASWNTSNLRPVMAGGSTSSHALANSSPPARSHRSSAARTDGRSRATTSGCSRHRLTLGLLQALVAA